MRNLRLLLPVLFIGFFAQSCLNDDDEPQIDYYETMAMVTSDGDKPSFETDFGIKLNSSMVLKSDTGKLFNVGDRVYLIFSYDDTTRNANKTYPITVKEYGPVTVSDFKTVQPDSVIPYFDQIIYHVYKYDITKNYFNSIIYTYQPLTSINSCELVRVLKNETNTPGSNFPTVNFELRHNASAVNYSFYKLRLNSYDLTPLAEEFSSADSIKINLKWSESTGLNQTYNFIYKPVPGDNLLNAGIKSISKTRLSKINQ